MLRVGITGNIGAGKSQVCKIFEILNIPVYYADPRAKQLMLTNPGLKEGILNLFGEKAYLDAKNLDRKYIASIVFTDPSKLAKLNGLVHPAVADDFEDWSKAQQHHPYVVKEAALLFEAGSYKQLDYNVLVYADEALRLKRVVMRDKVSETEVRNRMDKQMSQQKKMTLADYTIDNNGSESLVKQVLKLHSIFLNAPKSEL